MNLKTFANLEVDEYSSECSWTCASWIRCNWDYSVMGGRETGSLDLKAKKHEWVKTLAPTVQHWNPSNGTSRMGHAATSPVGCVERDDASFNWQAGRDELSRQSGRAFITGPKRARKNWVRKKGWVMWTSLDY
jgi:hypothetical protein